MKKILWVLFTIICAFDVQAQSRENRYLEYIEQRERLQNRYDEAEKLKDIELNKDAKGFIRSSGDQKEARNLLILKAVVNYKFGDEKLAKEIDAMETNKEYNKKLQKVMKELSNKKIRNSKNKKVMNILDEAGNKLYNLLAN